MQEGYEHIGQDIHEFINQIQDKEIRFICSGIILDGKTIKSIAEEYKMDPRTVKKKARKALEKLYRQIQQ